MFMLVDYDSDRFNEISF